MIVPTIETFRQRYFLETFVTHAVPLLFVGPTGTGKSMVTINYLLNLPKEKQVL